MVLSFICWCCFPLPILSQRTNQPNHWSGGWWVEIHFEMERRTSLANELDRDVALQFAGCCIAVQICRKICVLGCVTHVLVCAWFTQPSPHIFLHFCTVTKLSSMLPNLIRDSWSVCSVCRSSSLITPFQTSHRFSLHKSSAWFQGRAWTGTLVDRDSRKSRSEWGIPMP